MSRPDAPGPAELARLEQLVRLEQLARQAAGDESCLSCMPVAELVALCRHLAARVAEREGAPVQAMANAEKMEAMGMFAGGIAHDFNNILGIIANRATLALVAQYSNPDQCEHMKQIIRATDRGKELIKQILTFSRPGSGELVPLALGPILEDTASFLTASLPASVAVRLEACPCPVVVRGDPTQVSQIVMNLAANAAAAMPTGGALTIRLGLGEGEALIEVEDTGQGMNEEVLRRIFEPYFTTRSGGRGTGLGLAVVHGIVKRHGGTIHCESWPGRGTRFTIRLGACGGEVAAGPTGPEASGAEAVLPHLNHSLNHGQGHSHSQCRILFVDDEAELARSSRKLLESFGHQPTVYTNPAQALADFSRAPYSYDVVITDMLMPDMNGQELSREVLALNPAMPIILCTGYSEAFTREQALAAGIRGYVPKPIDWIELNTLIGELTAKGHPLPRA